MSEKDNAIAPSVELVPYTESRRDELELELAEVSNKREINRRSNNGITVVAYYLMREKVVVMYVHDARNNGSAEYEVDPANVMEEFEHPFANPGSWEIPNYRQSENDGA